MSFKFCSFKLLKILYKLTVIFPFLFASSRCARAFKNGSLSSLPELVKVLQIMQKQIKSPSEY